MNLALYGPPGSGKGTQAQRLGDRFQLDHVSSGDILRAERKAGTELGRKVEEIMKRGELVPDEIVGELIQKKIQQCHAEGRGVIFDGYPRNMRQLQRVEALLKVLDAQLDCAVTLDIDPEKLTERLTSRRVCDQCQHVYNLISHSPKVEGQCDQCGGRLIQRNDDRPEAIRRRLVEYREQTEPMLRDLDNRGRLHRIAADRSIDEVWNDLSGLIERLQKG